MHIRLTTTFLSILAVLGTGNASAQEDAAKAVRFSLPSPRITLHEPAVVMFQAMNLTSTALQFDLGQDRKQNFLFALTLPTGERIELPRFRKSGLARIGRIVLKPGQTYSQRLLVNQWYDFKDAGLYELEVTLAKPILTQNGATLGKPEPFRAVLDIEARNEPTLAKACAEITARIQESASYEDASEAALELSYVRDPVAVPYLERALKAPKLVEPIAITGLESIGNADAVRALGSALQIQRDNASVLARAALQRIAQATSDPEVRQQVAKILKTNPSEEKQ